MNRSVPGSPPAPLTSALCFIEQQFPVARLSMESYKERTAKQSQTLTGLGKWWGRKPLVLVRAALLGLLLPATDDPHKDRGIFLKLMTMDAEGLQRRKNKPIPTARLVEEVLRLPPAVQANYLKENDGGQPVLCRLNGEEREELQSLVFERLSYAEKLTYCARPEQIDGPSESAWVEINAHLGTQVSNLDELVQELGWRRFGHAPRVGDAFCGGGSVPFEAARLGCDVYASDLNPAAALLTWAALNISGGGTATEVAVENAQQTVYQAVERQIGEWGLEQNSLGWRADAYLYCVEVTDPESGWQVPLAPSWVIGKKSCTIARLIPDLQHRRYEIEILEGVSEKEMQQADASGTVKNSYLIPPDGGPPTPIETLRREMRLWENEDLAPRPGDVFQERLYCIRWVETYLDDQGRPRTRRHYRAPTGEDMQREARMLELLRERFSTWQQRGYVPDRRIESGDETSRLQRERGWTHWHHLFNPRQLLLLGCLLEKSEELLHDETEKAAVLLGVGRAADYNARLSRWHPRSIGDKSEQTFSNQALNTLYNYGCRPFSSLASAFFLNLTTSDLQVKSQVRPADARLIDYTADLWITDPPYADAVNYEEITEFFLAWYDRTLLRIFPVWYSDSKRSLAVKGNKLDFRQSMVECYQRLAWKMPENGLQLVMFTHQDASVWADLSLILWAAGLRVTAAWTIATETDSALKQGNYVQGTVLLVLRKRMESEAAFLDEIYPRVEAEVRRQLSVMLEMEDASEPNFGDADYQLAAYAAALRVLTERPIYEINPEREILRPRQPGQVNAVETLIRQAVKIACDHLTPRGLERDTWKRLEPSERFYLKGLEVESHGEYRSGVYQELARGFGAADYDDLLANTRANETRLKRPGEFGERQLASAGFSGTLTRQCLFAIALTAKDGETKPGLNYLRTELGQEYWAVRERIVQILEYLARLSYAEPMQHWQQDAHAAMLLGGAVRNDHV